MPLTSFDEADLARIRANVAEYHRRRAIAVSAEFWAEWCGRFDVNVEELLDMIGRLTAPELVPSGTGWPVA